MEFLEKYRVKQIPDVAYYVPDFVSASEEQFLLDHIYASPKPKWKQLSNRRLQNWGGLPHPKGMLSESLPSWLQTYVDKVASLNVFDDKIPNHVLINEYLAGQGIMPHTDGPLFYPTISTVNLGSHTVLNFYKPLLQSENDAERVESNPVMLNDEEAMQSNGNLSSSDGQQSGFVFSLLLLPRSCLILKGSLYHVYHHGIDECYSDIIDCAKILNLDACRVENKLDDELRRSTRVSLTIRHVPKTLKIQLGKTRNQ